MPFTPTDYLPYDFANRRHIGPSPAEMAHMLETLGLSSLEALIDETLPKSMPKDAFKLWKAQIRKSSFKSYADNCI